MLIHTIVPIDQVLDNSVTNISQTKTKYLNGSYLQGSQTKEGFKIDRIISTDLKMYLNDKYAPGKLIK